ncbi:MAG: ABC transporter permease, partial [Bacteroidota bacterium]
MNVPFFIARKYFLSGKKKNFINVISIISMVVVAIGTASLIIALSVFNGLEGLLRNMYGNFDPDVIIQPSSGKSFEFDQEDLALIEGKQGVVAVTKVVEDNVLVRYKEAQRVVRMKGASREFDEYSGIKKSIVSGELPLVR